MMRRKLPILLMAVLASVASAYEDMSTETGPYTFTQTGSGSGLSRTVPRWTSVGATDLLMDDGGRLYKDFGAGYFDDFTIQFVWQGATSGWAAWTGHNVGFANEQNDYTAIVDAGDSIWVSFYLKETAGETAYITLKSVDDGGTPVTDTSDGTATITKGTVYYVTWTRSDTSMTVTIRTTSHTGEVVDTLNVNGVTTAMRWFYPVNTQTDGAVAPFAGYAENYDLTAGGAETYVGLLKQTLNSPVLHGDTLSGGLHE